MAGLSLTLAFALSAGPAEASERTGPDPGDEIQIDGRKHKRVEQVARPPRRSLRSWLGRPVPWSARFVDHGVLEVSAAGGTPSLYRLELRLGILDLLTLGATAHWLPSQAQPRVMPTAALAFWRGRWIEIGGRYQPVLDPPPKAPVGEDGGPLLDEQGEAVKPFERRTHMALGTVVLTSGLVSTGFDAGAAHVRIPVADPMDRASFRRRTVFAGGIFLRVGTRRFGLIADAHGALSPDPLLTFELKADVRFGLFEERSRGQWRVW